MFQLKGCQICAIFFSISFVCDFAINFLKKHISWDVMVFFRRCTQLGWLLLCRICANLTAACPAWPFFPHLTRIHLRNSFKQRVFTPLRTEETYAEDWWSENPHNHIMYIVHCTVFLSVLDDITWEGVVQYVGWERSKRMDRIEGTWRRYCDCVTVELVSSVCTQQSNSEYTKTSSPANGKYKEDFFQGDFFYMYLI